MTAAASLAMIGIHEQDSIMWHMTRSSWIVKPPAWVSPMTSLLLAFIRGVWHHDEITGAAECCCAHCDDRLGSAHFRTCLYMSVHIPRWRAHLPSDRKCQRLVWRVTAFCRNTSRCVCLGSWLDNSRATWAMGLVCSDSGSQRIWRSGLCLPNTYDNPRWQRIAACPPGMCVV